MKSLFVLGIGALSLVSAPLFGDVVFRQATQEDVPGIVKMYEDATEDDRTRIVILPKAFRQNAIKSTIQHGKLYVAQDKETGEIVGLKKLFTISDRGEYREITRDEIRCKGSESTLVDAGTLTVNNEGIKKEPTSSALPFSFKNSMVIYNGGDFTPEQHRSRGINSGLTQLAFGKMLERFGAQHHGAAQSPDPQNVVLLYGLTQANAEETADGIDRTPSIARSFLQFTKAAHSALHPGTTAPATLHHARYRAFMPTFDPDAKECKPLPDDQSVAGYGNVLIYQRNKEELLS